MNCKWETETETETQVEEAGHQLRESECRDERINFVCRQRSK